MSEKIVQTAGRQQLGEFAPMFAHLNEDVLFGEVWNEAAIDVKTKCIITVVSLMASGITDSSLIYHLQNAKAHGVTKEEISLRASGAPTYTIFVCPDGMKKSEGQDAKAKAIVQACKTVPSPGEGLCAAWVTKVYMAAGVGNPTGDARDMYAALPKLSEKDVRERRRLSPGMIVALQTCNGGSDAKTYGHVGIYIGNGQIMDNVGHIETQSIDLWLSKYCPAGMLPRWGYL